jgi:hypothetical protein
MQPAWRRRVHDMQRSDLRQRRNEGNRARATTEDRLGAWGDHPMRRDAMHGIRIASERLVKA